MVPAMSAAKAGVPFIVGVVLSLFGIFGGVSAITPAANSTSINVVNYDAR